LFSKNDQEALFAEQMLKQNCLTLNKAVQQDRKSAIMQVRNSGGSTMLRSHHSGASF